MSRKLEMKTAKDRHLQRMLHEARWTRLRTAFWRPETQEMRALRLRAAELDRRIAALA